MGTGNITEIFGVLPEIVMNNGSPEDVFNIMKGESGSFTTPFDTVDMGAGSELSTFDKILAETGDINVASAAAKMATMEAIINEQAASREEEVQTKIDVAAKAFVDAQKAAEEELIAVEANPGLGMTPGVVALKAWEKTPDKAIIERFSETYGVGEQALMDTINEIKAETDKWEAFDPAASGIAGFDPYEQLNLGVGEEPTTLQNAMVEAMMAEQNLTPEDNANALIGSILATPFDVQGVAAASPDFDDLPQIMGANQTATLSKLSPTDAISTLLTALQDQFIDYGTYPTATGYGDTMGYYRDMIDTILNSKIAKGTDWGGTSANDVIEQWATASPESMALRSGNIDYLLNNPEIKNWFDQSVEQGFSVPMGPVPEGPGLGWKGGAKGGFPVLTGDWPELGFGMKGGAKGAIPTVSVTSPQATEAAWWTNLSPAVQVMLMDAVNTAQKTKDTPVDVTTGDDLTPMTPTFTMTDDIANWIAASVGYALDPELLAPPDITKTVWGSKLTTEEIEAINNEVTSQVTAALAEAPTTATATAADAATAATTATGVPAQKTTLDQLIVGGTLLETPPDYSGFEWLVDATTANKVKAALWYDPKDGVTYANVGGSWTNLGASTLSTLPNSQFTLEIGFEGSGYFLTGSGEPERYKRGWFIGDQTGATNAETGLSAMTGIPPLSIAETFYGRPGALWEAARTEQLGEKAHNPQYWKTRMQGFTPAWGRHILSSQPGESFYSYLSRSGGAPSTADDWGLAVQASGAMGTQFLPGATDTERIRAHRMKTLMSSKAEVLAMASAGLGINPDTYMGNAAYTGLSNMYDIFEQQEAGKAGDPGKFLSWLDNLMSGQATTATGNEGVPTDALTVDLGTSGDSSTPFADYAGIAGT